MFLDGCVLTVFAIIQVPWHCDALCSFGGCVVGAYRTFRRRRKREFLDFINDWFKNIVTKSCLWFSTISTPISVMKTAG